MTVATALRATATVVAMAVASVVLGGVTSFAQTALPDALRSLANSASGWTLVTAVLVVLARRGTAESAILGLVGFVGLVLGYQLTSTLRGYPDNGSFLLIAILSGPIVGIAAGWLRRRDVRGAVGVGVLSGIGVGESIYGLLLLLGSTSWVYWALIGLGALGVLAWAVARLGRVRDRLIAPAVALAVAAALFTVAVLA